MAGYLDTKKLIEDTLVGRPAGTMIYPEDHQNFALSLLDYIHSVELLGASSLQGIATPTTVPVQPDDAYVSYIATVPSGETYTFTNFHDENGDPISVTSAENTVSLLTLLWNGEYWQVQVNAVQLAIGYSDGYLFKGMAEPDDTPEEPDQNVCYLATTAGDYEAFGGITIDDGEVAWLLWNGEWSKETTGIATAEACRELGEYADNSSWVRAITDANGKFLAGIRKDGSVEWAVGIPIPVKRSIEELAESIDSKVDVIPGKTLIDENVVDSLLIGESEEYLRVELDETNKILGGRKKNGLKVEKSGLEVWEGAVFEGTKDSDERVSILLDDTNKIISYREKDGTLVEDSIKVKNLNVQGQNFEEILAAIEESIKGDKSDVIPYNDFIYIGGRSLKIYNPYKESRNNQYSGQLHCHSWTKYAEAVYPGKYPYGYSPDYVNTLTSEQRQALIDQVSAEFVQRHKDLGYDFMTLSNYAAFEDLTPKPSPFPNNFLWIWDAYETTSTDHCHVIVWNTKNVVLPYGTGPFNEVKENVQKMGCICELPHPFDNNGSSSPEVLDTIKKSLRFIEVYDGVSIRKWRPDGTMYNRESIPAGLMIDSAFDHLLSNGNFIFGTAISDERPAYGRTGEAMVTENPANNLKNGCVKVFADELTNDAILQAMLSGNFYASSSLDASINSVSIQNGKYIVNVGIADVVVEFVKEDNTVVKTVTTSVGNTSAEYDITGEEKFVRARVYKLNADPYDPDYWYKNKEWMIWTQPVFISKTII